MKYILSIRKQLAVESRVTGEQVILVAPVTVDDVSLAFNTYDFSNNFKDIPIGLKNATNS